MALTSPSTTATNHNRLPTKPTNQKGRPAMAALFTGFIREVGADKSTTSHRGASTMVQERQRCDTSQPRASESSSAALGDEPHTTQRREASEHAKSAHPCACLDAPPLILTLRAAGFPFSAKARAAPWADMPRAFGAPDNQPRTNFPDAPPFFYPSPPRSLMFARHVFPADCLHHTRQAVSKGRRLPSIFSLPNNRAL